MREKLDDVRGAGAELILVGNGSVKFAAHFQQERAPELRVFTDPSLESYKALGMKRSAGATLSPAALVAGARAIAHGHIQTSVEGDGWQQGGLYAIARGGRIVYSRPNDNAGDRPDIDAALAALKAAAGPA